MFRKMSSAVSRALWGAAGVGHYYASRNFAEDIDDMCERCPNDGTSHDFVNQAVSAKICRECMREYQTNDQVRTLKQMMVRKHVVMQAHVYNGVADEADRAVLASMEAESKLFAFTMAWLAEHVPRAGKTRADVIAAWEVEQRSRHAANERVKNDIRAEIDRNPPAGHGG